MKDGLDSLVGDSRVRKELAIKAQKAIEEFLELGASEHLDELVLVGSFLSPTKQPNDIDIVYVGKDAVAVGEMQRIHGTMLNSGSLDLQVNILPGRRDHRFMGWLERSTKERYGVDPLVLFARTTKLSEPNLALSLQEMGYEKSIEYLIEHDYHFRTDGKRIAILGSSKSGHYGHKGIPGHRGGSVASGTPGKWHEGAYGDIAQDVPIAELEKYQEHNWSEYYHPRMSQEEYDKLKVDIGQNGIDDPLIIDYNPTNGYALVSEGNHRIAIARELGWVRLPARLIRSKYLDSKTKGAKRVEDSKLLTKEYVPRDIRPDMVFPDE